MIPQYEPYYGFLEKQRIQEYMDNPGWITEYKYTTQFEEDICSYLRVSHCSVVNNGTIAICLALLSVGVKPGDVVVIPDMTMFATASAVTFIGASVRVVDICEDTLLMDLDTLQMVLSKEKIKAVIYVSFNGRWDATGNLMQLKNDFPEVSFIEDSAQSFGSFNYRGKVGGDLDISTFSFSVPKIITTGQGGCIVTNDSVISKRVKQLKDFGRQEGNPDVHVGYGINSKFTELQAILGVSQMEQLPYRTARKIQMYKLYSSLLKDLPQVQMVGIDDFTVPWFVDVKANDRDALASYLLGKGIGTRKVYLPISRQFAFSYLGKTGKTIADTFSDTGLWLPSSFTLKDSQIEEICEAIKGFYL